MNSLDLAECAGRFMFLGTTWRTFAPGVKLDEMPVLISRQGGIGKSTALARILPPEFDHLFSDSLNFGGDAKQKVESLQGRAIVEGRKWQARPAPNWNQ